jgi:histidine triad (HIT) family protein
MAAADPKTPANSVPSGETSAPSPDSKPSVTLKDLQAAVRDLFYSSESDEPLKAVSLTPEKFGSSQITPEAVAPYRNVDASKIKTLGVAEFFAPMTTPQNWWGDEEKETGAKFTALVKLLTERLTETKVFRIGDGPEIEVLVLGKNDRGNILGIRTQLTET